MSEYIDFVPQITSSPIKSSSGCESDLDSEEEQAIVFKANYLLFGTYMSYCRTIELDPLFLKMTSVSPNISGIRFTYNINIGFSDITRLMYCLDSIDCLIFIEMNESSNHLIQNAMNLGHNSLFGLRYDVNSEDIVERYIAIDFSEDNSNKQLIKRVIRSAKAANNEIIVKQMITSNAKKYLSQNHRKCVAYYRLHEKRGEPSLQWNRSVEDISCQFSPTYD